MIRRTAEDSSGTSYSSQIGDVLRIGHYSATDSKVAEGPSGGPCRFRVKIGDGRDLCLGVELHLKFMRSFAAREAESPRAMAVMAPGWIRTDLGGPDVPLTIDESIPSLVRVLLAKRERPGLEYLNQHGETVPW